MKNLSTFFSAAMIALFFLSSCGAKQDKPQNAVAETKMMKDTASSKTDTVATTAVADAKPSDPKDEEAKLKKFLIDTKDHYGWETKSDKISLDFFEDGRLHIQGPDGEATMWEGSWKLKGNQLTTVRGDLKKTITVTAKMDGEKLILGDKTYTRYKP